MFEHRFESSNNTNRAPLSFASEVASASALKAEWDFISESALRANIAYTLQSVQFDVLLVNRYNVFWTPLSMKYKHAIVQAASVAEAVLQYMLKHIEEHPAVLEVLGRRWNWLDFNSVPLPGVELPEGQRAVTGMQQQVQNVLDANTKMKALVRASRKAEILDDALADRLDVLREQRNRIHIKTLTEPEYGGYNAEMANNAIEAVEQLRLVARDWSVNRNAAAAPITESDSNPFAIPADWLAPGDDSPF